uniref:UPAR/Ly6 domain-containing protein n=1 Tax=Stegastes partitus TaxID=144197 RepID=A0A3B5AMA5_9TELE
MKEARRKCVSTYSTHKVRLNGYSVGGCWRALHFFKTYILFLGSLSRLCFTFELVVTECPPNEHCFKAEGRYGNHSALSARGCMLEDDCSQKHNISIKGTVYTMSYACCDWPYCNSCLGITANPLYNILPRSLSLTSRFMLAFLITFQP